jgi:AAA domain/PD-(D/E)XK nuclease superfamily
MALALHVLAPLFPVPDGTVRKLTPTDVSQFIRLEQCERFLRLRLGQRAGQPFMEAVDAAPQSIPPLLTLAGGQFEDRLEEKIAEQHPIRNFAREAGEAGNRPVNNAEVARLAHDLPPDGTLVLFQVRLEAEVDGWLIRGDADIVRMAKDQTGALDVLVTDMKSTTRAKVEHRLQVAFYHLLLERLFERGAIGPATIRTSILFRGVPEEQVLDEGLAAQREAARKWLGLDEGLLEIVADPDAYRQAVIDLVTGPDSTARRIGRTPFEEVPYALSYKCDGCLYNEFCMRWSAEQDDLALLPHLSAVEKEVLREAGIRTVAELALLKDFRAPAGDGPERYELVPGAGQEALVRRLSVTWPVGRRLDELVHRARAYRRHVKKEPLAALTFIPSKGYSSLPHADAGLNPNLVRVYIDAQHDYLNDRVYMVGALVEACEDGVPRRRQSLVHLCDAPPDDINREKQLLVRWTADLLRAVVESAFPDGDGEKKAPIHLVFFNHFGYRLLLEALARNYQDVLGETPPLYDFLTQLAAFDTPVASFLEQEIQEFKNYPLLCQSLHAVAAYLRFDWDQPEPYRTLFRERVFDYQGKLDADAEDSEWYTKRARFNSQIPLEYAYAAWNRLPMATADGNDEFAPYRPVTAEQLRNFQGRRLEALAHIAGKFPGNRQSAKQPFVLPELGDFADKARTLAHALDEFVTIERHVTLNAWKGIRHAPPERRVLMGESLLVRYHAADQGPGVAELVETGGAGQDGVALRLRVETNGLDCDLEEALTLCNFRPEDRLVLSPRLTWDERLPEAERTLFTPTPRQMLYAPRVILKRVVIDGRDDQGRAAPAYLDVDGQGSRFAKDLPGYVFSSFKKPLADGELYTLDPCPNDWYGYFCARVIKALCKQVEAGFAEGNMLYQRVASPSTDVTVQWPAAAAEGQRRFMQGLDAMEQAGAIHDFEPSKRDYIGGHGADPILLVQGPPGTGKSYATAFALFARLQGALAAGQPFRALASCKTHAATDELLRNILKVKTALREMRGAQPALFAHFFDERLLKVPVCRVAPRDTVPDGATVLPRDDKSNAWRLMQARHVLAAVTPGGVYRMVKDAWNKQLIGNHFAQCLVLDEASQMSLPEAIMAALPLEATGQVIIVGDHRQMPPIVKHDWDLEPRRTFQEFRAHASLYEAVRALNPPLIQFAESFRLHAAMAEFLRREVYQHDGIHYFSRKRDVLPAIAFADDFVTAVLRPEYPLVVVVHGETGSQMRNEYEQALISPIIAALSDPAGHGLEAAKGLGVVVPHRAQRAALQQAFPSLSVFDDEGTVVRGSAIDTVERFQGGERTVILVSATESNRAYLLAASEFLLDPRRLTVALSRAKRKLVLVASRSIFELFSADEETFAHSQLWKNLLRRTCTVRLWHAERNNRPVTVWGNG